jgi:hypothetical protein
LLENPFFFFFKEASLYIVLDFETTYLMAVIILENIFTFQLAIRVVAFVLLMMLLASPLCIAIRAHQRDSDRISQIAFIERDQLIDDSNQLDAEKIYVKQDSAGHHYFPNSTDQEMDSNDRTLQ